MRRLLSLQVLGPVTLIGLVVFLVSYRPEKNSHTGKSVDSDPQPVTKLDSGMSTNKDRMATVPEGPPPPPSIELELFDPEACLLTTEHTLGGKKHNAPGLKWKIKYRLIRGRPTPEN